MSILHRLYKTRIIFEIGHVLDFQDYFQNAQPQVYERLVLRVSRAGIRPRRNAAVSWQVIDIQEENKSTAQLAR